jgi:signal peptidase
MSVPQATRSGTFLYVSSELLARGYHVRFRAEGSSMYPTIRDKDAITVVAAEPSEIRTGDVVLYRLPHGVIAHRVVGKRTHEGVTTFVLRGDAADSRDAPVGSAQILGKVLWVHRAGRCISLAGRWARLRQLLRAGGSRMKRALLGPGGGRARLPRSGRVDRLR